MEINFFMGFIVILSLLSSSLDKVKNMYQIACFHLSNHIAKGPTFVGHGF